MLSLRRLVISVVGVSLLATACSGPPAQPSGAAAGPGTTADKPIVIGVGAGLPQIQFSYMRDKHQLEAKGYKPQWQYFDSPVAAAQAFTAGKVDLAIEIGFATIAQMAEQGVPMVLIGSVAYSTVGGIYSKDLTSPAQLRGKRVGMLPKATQTTMLTLLLLQDRYGLEADKDFQALYQDGAAGYLLLNKGDLAAGLNMSGEAVKLERQGYHLIFDLNGEWKAQTTHDLYLASLIASPTFVQQNGAYLRTFMELVLQNRDALRGPEQAALRDLALRELKLTEEDASLILPALMNSLAGAGYGPDVEAGVQSVFDAMLKHQLLKQAPKIPWWHPDQ